MTYPPSEIAPLLEELDISGPTQPFLVLADWLLQRDDRWGELITEQCMAIEGDQQYKRSKEVLGLPVGWVGVLRRGFVVRAIYDVREVAKDTFAADLEALLAMPIAHLLADFEVRYAQISHVAAIHAHRARLERSRIELVEPQVDRAVILALLGEQQNVTIVGGWVAEQPMGQQTWT